MPAFDEEFLLQARQPMVHFGYHTSDDAQFQRACADASLARDLGVQNSEAWWLIPGRAFSGCAGDSGAAPLYTAPTTLASSKGGGQVIATPGPLTPGTALVAGRSCVC